MKVRRCCNEDWKKDEERKKMMTITLSIGHCIKNWKWVEQEEEEAMEKKRLKDWNEIAWKLCFLGFTETALNSENPNWKYFSPFLILFSSLNQKTKLDEANKLNKEETTWNSFHFASHHNQSQWVEWKAKWIRKVKRGKELRRKKLNKIFMQNFKI